MPWKTESVMEQRLSFVIEARKPGAKVSELSRQYGVSRETGHKCKAISRIWKSSRTEG